MKRPSGSPHRPLLVGAVLRFGAIALISASYATTGQSQPLRPNIVLLMVDDMGFSDLGCYGAEIDTPNLDRLAENGLRFTQFYNAGKCAPSRACAMTGLYAEQTGMSGRGSGGGRLRNSVTVAELLRSAGYRTLMTGKWHGEDNPYDRGFDRYYGLRSGAMNHFNPGRQRPGEKSPARKNPRVWINDDYVFPEGEYTPEPSFYSTDAFTDKAMEYLREYENEDRPFFLYIAYTAPHFPLQAWEEDIARYRGRYLSGWEALRRSRYEKQKRIGIVRDERTMSLSQADIFARDPRYEENSNLREWEELEDAGREEWDLRMAVYAAMIDRVDQQVGRLVQMLVDRGDLENTLILFCSDNGGCAQYVDLSSPGARTGTMESYRTVDKPWANVSNTPLRYFKHYSHEGGITTPLIVHWPAVIRAESAANRGFGKVTDGVGHFIDFMPTFLEISGAVYPDVHEGEPVLPYEGESLFPLFVNGMCPRSTNPLFWEYEGAMAVRRGNWKLVREPDGPLELYNLAVDRSETKNLADAMPAERDELNDLYGDWASRPDVDVDF